MHTAMPSETPRSRGFAAQHRGVVIALAIVLAVAVVAAVAGISMALSSSSGSADPAGENAGPAIGSPSPTASATAPAGPEAVAACGHATATVTTAEELQDALDGASPGDVIALAPGTYQGRFVASVDGTADAPIALCGTADSVLDGGGIKKGYVFHLDNVAYWTLSGFAVQNGQKGVMADGTTHSQIVGLQVSHTGDEAIHLRDSSTDNLVADNTIGDTGLRKPKFGEGIYIGTAESNWCDISDCNPDPSDRNVIERNAISGTTSESVDIKEGTSGGTLRDNTFDGSAMVEADSWVDVKGNDWLIEGNTGTGSPADGFQTHEILDGWGTGNIFRSNTAQLQGAGIAISLTPKRDNVVECSNTVSGPGAEVSNATCRG